MTSQLSAQCENCGTPLDAPAQNTTSVRCSVCQFLNSVSAPAETIPFTRDSLEQNLGILIEQARAGGLTSEEIVAALRDELEFAAELSHFGRHMCVQIIDLGPQDVQAAHQPIPDRSAVLRGRALGG